MLALTLLGPLLFACTIPPAAAPEPAVTTVPEEPSGALLGRTPQRIVVNGQELRLQVSLWRDFMPGPGPQRRPLRGVAEVTSADQGRVATALQVERLWILHKPDDVWEARRPLQASDLSVVITDGPEWDPGTVVDVVVQLTDGASKYLLRKADTAIQATQ